MESLNDHVSTPPDKELVDGILNENRVDEFWRLRGAPGICLEPLQWETIKQYVESNTVESLSTLGRKPEGIVVYRRFRKERLQKYASMGDFVKITILHFASAANSEGKLEAVDGSCPLKNPVWKENDFPYNFEHGIKHHNLWFTSPLSEEELCAEIEKEMPDRETLHFVNPFPLASIPAVWHAHIVSRAKLKPATKPLQAISILEDESSSTTALC